MLGRRFGSLVLVATLVVVGCGGKQFEGGGGGATGGSAGSGAGGAGALGGGGGAGALGGSGGGGLVAGAGGMAGCACEATQYCRNGDCFDCSDLSSLTLGPPELMLDHPSTAVRFPRVGDQAGSFFYRQGAEGAGQLWYTTNIAGLGRFVGDPMANQESGALYLGELDRGFNLVFDQTINGLRSARSASWSGAVSNVMPMPPPLTPGGFDDFSVAIASQTERAYWMSTRDGTTTLRTGTLTTGNTDLVELRVPARSGGGTCPRTGGDATPWVTAEGSLLLFRAFPVDAQCQPVDGDATDLYAVPVDPASGLPTRDAVALTGANTTGGASTETDPSFSPDLCTLYFASDGGSNGADFKLYRSPRR